MAATRNQFNEKQLIPYMWHSNPTSLPMLRPCIALPQRAAHALGSSTGRRSSLDGRRSWGRGRGRPVCRSSGIRTWGTPFSCLRPSTMRRDPLHITHSGRHGARSNGHPAHARACAKVATCLPGSQMHTAATIPRSNGTKIFTN